MIKTSKTVINQVMQITLTGVIDDSTELLQLIGTPVEHELHFFLRQITRINSAGLKKAQTYFKSLRALGKSMTILELSPALVTQLNMVPNLFAGGEVESVCLSYFCENCELEELRVGKIADLRPLNFEPPVMNCPNCSKSMEFDDIPSDYFDYWMR